MAGGSRYRRLRSGGAEVRRGTHRNHRVWVAYSADALYIAVRVPRTPTRGAIVATDMRRDASVEENDNIEFILDTYHDRRNAYYFATNAAGALVDGRITENRDPATEWDGIWIVRTRIDKTGWTAEFKIPFKTIGFDPARRGVGIQHLTISRPRAGDVAVGVALAGCQAFPRGSRGHPDGARGHLTGCWSRRETVRDHGRHAGHHRIRQWNGTADAGGDIFYRITSNLIRAPRSTRISPRPKSMPVR